MAGGLGPRRDPLGSQLGGELAEQERIAPGDLEAGGTELAVDELAERALEQAGGGGRSERGGLKQESSAIGRQPLERLAGGALLALARRGDDQHRELFDPLRQVREPAQRLLVGPVEVIEAEDEGLGLGEVRTDPVQAAHQRLDRVRIDAGHAQRLAAKQRRAEARGAAQQPLALRARRPGRRAARTAGPRPRAGYRSRAPRPARRAPAARSLAPPRRRRGAGSTCRSPPRPRSTPAGRRRPSRPRSRREASAARARARAAATPPPHRGSIPLARRLGIHLVLPLSRPIICGVAGPPSGTRCRKTGSRP